MLSPTSSSGDSELSPSEDNVDEEVFIFSSESTSELVEASFTCLLAKIGCVFCCFAVLGAILLMGRVSCKYSGGIIMGLMWLAVNNLL